MILNVNLAVKFRAFGITFGTVTQGWNIPLDLPALISLPAKLIAFNERGVQLNVNLLANTGTKAA